MKINKFILSGLVMPAGLACALPIVACANTKLEVSLTTSEHVKNAKFLATPEVDKQAIITFSLDKGWREIDFDKTTIQLGNKKLALGTDYTIDAVNGNIKILPNVIKNEKLAVHIEAKATPIGITANWKNGKGGKVFNGNLVAPSNTKISTDTISVSIVKGDNSLEEIKWAPTSEEKVGTYSVYTSPSMTKEVENFDQGSISIGTSTTDIQSFWIRYDNKYFDSWQEVGYSALGSGTIDSLTIKTQYDEEAGVYYAHKDVPAEIAVSTESNCCPACTFEIVKDETESQACKFENFGFEHKTWDGFLRTESVGKVTVRARSCINQNVVSDPITIFVIDELPETNN